MKTEVGWSSGPSSTQIQVEVILLNLAARPVEEDGQGLAFPSGSLVSRSGARAGPSTAAPPPRPAGGRPPSSARWPAPRS